MEIRTRSGTWCRIVSPEWVALKSIYIGGPAGKAGSPDISLVHLRVSGRMKRS